ncbi:MAG: hypothetical protein SGPRY_006685, partial [Prymnesium sp.]
MSSAALLRMLQGLCPLAELTLEHPSRLDGFIETARTAGAVAPRLALLIDYDLTISAPDSSECHHMLRDAEAMPDGFREEVRSIFCARASDHPRHAALYGAAEQQPHQFWIHYNAALVHHGVTRKMIEAAVAQEKACRGKLLREGVGELLSLCKEAGVLVVILSAGIEQVIRESFRQDGIEIPAECHVLTNTLVFDEDEVCVAVEPTSPPASRVGKLNLLKILSKELSTRDLVVMVGDKPVDARVTCGLSPARREEKDRQDPTVRAELSFGFFNERPVEEGTIAAELSEW